MTVVPDVSWPAHIRQVVRAELALTSPFGVEVHAYDTTSSTSDVAAQLAFEGCPEGTVVVAATQTRGRGRRGARFHSPADRGLYCSTVLRPAAWPSALRDPEGVPRAITLMAGVAVVDAVHALGVTSAELKWPNDVIVRPRQGRGWRKLAGILAEASVDTHGLQHVVLGIGINVQSVSPDVGLDGIATSLADVAARVVSVDATLVALLHALAVAHRELSMHGPHRVVQAWRRHAPAMAGRRVTWRDGDVWRTGIVRTVDDSGALCIETSAGLIRVVAGDLQWSTDDD